VFVVCVILILAKSLFPSNDNSVPDGEYTGTKPAETTTTTMPQQVVPDTDSVEVVLDLGDSDADSKEDENTDSTDSVAEGETAVLSQTAYLRSTGDENGEPIFSIDAGTEVTVLERPEGSEYVKVDFYGTEGCIWYGYLN
jgi:hypothetical protein